MTDKNKNTVIWSTSYISANGFACRLRVEGENGWDLLNEIGDVLDKLHEMGCKPSSPRVEFVSNEKDSKPNKEKRATGKMCPIHNVEMKKWEKNGNSWYSHLINGEWCTGK